MQVTQGDICKEIHEFECQHTLNRPLSRIQAEICSDLGANRYLKNKNSLQQGWRHSYSISSNCNFFFDSVWSLFLKEMIYPWDGLKNCKFAAGHNNVYFTFLGSSFFCWEVQKPITLFGWTWREIQGLGHIWFRPAQYDCPSYFSTRMSLYRQTRARSSSFGKRFCAWIMRITACQTSKDSPKYLANPCTRIKHKIYKHYLKPFTSRNVWGIAAYKNKEILRWFKEDSRLNLWCVMVQLDACFRWSKNMPKLNCRECKSLHVYLVSGLIW